MNSSLESTALRPIFAIGADLDLVAVQVGEEQRHARRSSSRILAACVVRVSSRTFSDSLRLGDPHLAAVDDVVVAVAPRERRDPRGVEAGVGLGDPEADVQRRRSTIARQRAPASSPREPCTITGCIPKIDRCIALAPFIAAPEAATSSSSSDASVIPNPLPPYSSGIVIPSQPAVARTRCRTPTGTRGRRPARTSTRRRTCGRAPRPRHGSSPGPRSARSPSFGILY